MSTANDQVTDHQFSILCCCADAVRYVTIAKLVDHLRGVDEEVNRTTDREARSVVLASAAGLVACKYLKIRQTPGRRTGDGKRIYEPQWKITATGRRRLESPEVEL